MILPTVLLFAASTLDLAGRIGIIRALGSEYVTLKVPLPVSANSLKLDSQGNFDWRANESATLAAKQFIAPGTVVQLTAITFTTHSITFQINGGVKKKKQKIFEKIQIGGGGGTRPVTGTEQDGFGSYVTIEFPNDTPDLTADEVKALLAAVFDFNKKSALGTYLDSIPEEFREAVKNKQAVVGMDKDMVLAALGRPLKRVREHDIPTDTFTETWIYGEKPLKVTFVVFTLSNLASPYGQVTSVKTF